MGEIINIFIGQCGVQLGNELWQQYLLEHDLTLSGFKNQSTQNQSEQNQYQNNLSIFFSETQQEKYVPRSVFIDLDPMTIDTLKQSSLKDVFSHKTLISDKEDSANIYTRGAYTLGKNQITSALHVISQLANNCDNLQGFMIYVSCNGGCSGLASTLLSRLDCDYGQKKIIISNTIIPSNNMSNTIVEPYNAVLSLEKINEYSHANILFQNQALYRICNDLMDIEQANYKEINQLMSQAISSLTNSIRFRGSLNISLNDFLINTIPYKRLNNIIPSYGPFYNSDNIQTDQNINANKITESVFQNDHCFIDCQLNKGTYMACTYNIRGDVSNKSIKDSICVQKYKQTITFADWSPTGFKLGISEKKPITLFYGQNSQTMPIDGCMFSNSTSITNFIDNLSRKFDSMYAYRSFTHWFVGEGMDSGEFACAREDLARLEKEYQEAI